MSQSYSVKRIWKRRHLSWELGTGRHTNYIPKQNACMKITLKSKFSDTRSSHSRHTRAQLWKPKDHNRRHRTTKLNPIPGYFVPINIHTSSLRTGWITVGRKIGLQGEKCYFIIKPTRCTNFTNLLVFWHETLHVSEISSVHHQEFIHCTLSNGIYHTGL